MMNKQCIDEFIEQHKCEAVALLEELGKIPAPSHREDKRAYFCRDWFVKNGCSNVHIDAAKNVVCEFNLDKYEDIVVFMAHMDVVFEDEDELPMSREGNILYAPGIGDDTANLVNLMIATRFLAKHQEELKTAVLVVANSCEEGLGNLEGCKQLFSSYGDRIKYVYSLDLYISQCASIPVGSHRYRVQIATEGGHSYIDFGRDNAIAIAADMINKLYQLQVPTKMQTTYNVGCIQGGTTINSIPAEVEFLYEYRSSSEECLALMKEKFMSVIDDFRNQGKQVEVSVIGIRPGLGDIDMDVLKAWTDENVTAIRQFYDGDMDYSPLSTDANIPLSRGVCANTIGTVAGGGAHTRGEWVDLDSIPTGLGIVMSLMSRYM